MRCESTKEDDRGLVHECALEFHAGRSMHLGDHRCKCGGTWPQVRAAVHELGEQVLDVPIGRRHLLADLLAGAAGGLLVLAVLVLLGWVVTR